MDDEAIRKRLHEKFRDGFPRALPPPVGHSIAIGAGRGQRCSVCDEPIGVLEAGPLECTYADGRRLYFHARCHVLWLEERSRANTK